MKQFITTLFIITWVFFSSTTLAHDEVKNYNLTDSQSQKIEQRLEIFFNKVEALSEERQANIYTTLQERIEKIINKYKDGTPQRAVLDILSISVDHMSEKDISTSPQKVLGHVIYGTDYHIVETISSEEVESEDEIIEEESEEIYRADLFTEELNEYDKDILAGTSAGIMSLRVRANLEPIETERVEISFNQDVDNIGLRWNLYHQWILVWHASASDVKNDIMIFDNITKLTIGETTSYLQLEIVTESIGLDTLWEAKNNVNIVRVSLQENKWTITWDNVWNKTYTETSRAFSIVPVKLTADLSSEFGKNISTSQIRLEADAGDNNDNGDWFSGKLTGIKVQVSGFDTAWDISVYNENGALIWSASISWSGDITISLNPDTISSRGETYKIITNAEAIFRIPQDGIIYSAGNNSFTTNLENEVFLGQR